MLLHHKPGYLISDCKSSFNKETNLRDFVTTANSPPEFDTLISGNLAKPTSPDLSDIPNSGIPIPGLESNVDPVLGPANLSLTEDLAYDKVLEITNPSSNPTIGGDEFSGGSQLEVALVGTSENMGKEGEIWEDMSNGDVTTFNSKDLNLENAIGEDN